LPCPDAHTWIANPQENTVADGPALHVHSGGDPRSGRGLAAAGRNM